MTLEVERLKLPGSGSRIYEATYFSNQFPSTPASCCLAIDDYHRNSELCATESSERIEYEYNPENGEREVEFDQKKDNPPVISFWSDSIEKPKPTQEELDKL